MMNQNGNQIVEIENICFKKMLFIYNALQDGWIVKKKGDKYIFTKKHENNKELYLDESFLTNFINKNSDIKQVLK